MPRRETALPSQSNPYRQESNYTEIICGPHSSFLFAHTTCSESQIHDDTNTKTQHI